MDCKLDEKIQDAIRNTLMAYNLNAEMVDKYLDLGGTFEYTKNSNRYAAAWVSKAGLECAFQIGREYNGIDKVYSDLVGVSSNYRIVDISNSKRRGFYPYKAMIKAMEELTGIQPYKSRAFELRITLDLEVYTAERKILVPADMSFTYFHKLIQNIFDWNNYHLYDGELPYLLEAKGQTPPEDVGGVGGFIEFRKIMLDKDNPNHEAAKEWVKFWTPELGEWKSRPQVINIWW